MTGTYYDLKFSDGKVNGYIILSKMSTLLDDKITTVKTRNQKILLKDVDMDRFLKTWLGQFKVDEQKKLRPLAANEARARAAAKTHDHNDTYTTTRTVKVREMSPEEVRAKAIPIPQPGLSRFEKCHLRKSEPRPKAIQNTAKS